jgi:DNA repair protein RadC
MGMFHQRAESLRLTGLEPARRFFAGLLAECDQSREHLWVAHVDDQSRCIHLTRFDGNEGDAPLPLREVVADTAIHGSAAIILAHNHPSGDPTPSPGDCAMTRRMALIGEAMDVAVLDHLVLAGSQCTSMRSMGLL